MRKILASFFVYIALALSVAAQSLSLSADTHEVEFGNPTSSNNLTTFTWFAAFRPSSLSVGIDGFLLSKDNAPTWSVARSIVIPGQAGSVGKVFCDIDRPTLSARIESSTNPVVNNADSFVACSINLSGVDADQKGYYGNYTGTNVAEVAYTTQRVGSGAAGDDSGVKWQTGAARDNSSTTAFRGRVYFVGVANAQLSQGELIQQQYNPRCTAKVIHLWYFGQNGTTGVQDLCGTANNSGSITGAALAAGLPIGGKSFGF